MIYYIKIHITFIKSSFEICINKTVCDDMVYCCCCFLVTLVGLFIIEIILFWYNKFRKFCTFLQVSWSNTLRLKSREIWNFLIDFFVLWKMQFRNFSKGSTNPFSGLYKTLCFHFCCRRFYWSRFYISAVNT